ncbi:MAG: DUF2851 family protein [Verrucomicrobiota bacterium]
MKNFYAAWLERNRVTNILRDGHRAPPEKLLQTIWQHQRLKRSELKTSAGRVIRILHPGFLSLEGGPDFRGAVLQFAGEAPITGDVEIDLHPGGWHAHGHDKNPNFKNVILHVVWDGIQNLKPKEGQAFLPEVLPLNQRLDSPIEELAVALENESGLPENLRGKCSAPLRELSAAQLAEILREAAQVRFQNKAEAMRHRAKTSGWEQTLWEQLFRALGYKHNVWPMQNLAETKSQWLRGTDSVFSLQARLLGVSGLLPAELTRSQKSSDTFLRRAWDHWWRDRDEFEHCTLLREIWKFHGLRPANHPQRRLAMAAHWLAAKNLVSKIENWCIAEEAEKSLNRSLQEVLQVEYDDYWSWHWTFKSARLAKPQPLLGEARVIDLAANVILPWLWIRAKEGGNSKLMCEMEKRYLAWPAAEDNSVLKLARQRLLGSQNNRLLKSAAEQQGLMQIVRDFCEQANATCKDCRFPDLLLARKHAEQGSALQGEG